MKQHIKTHRNIPQELIDAAMRDPQVGRSNRVASAQGPDAGPNGDGPQVPAPNSDGPQGPAPNGNGPPAQGPNGQAPQGPNGDGPQGPAPNF